MLVFLAFFGFTILCSILQHVFVSRVLRPACLSAPPLSSNISSYAVLEQHGAAVLLERLKLTSRVSAAAVEVLCEMLVIDRHVRPTSAELLAEHRFFTAPL